MEENESVDLSQKSNNHHGKIGISIMVVGMIILYSDGIRLIYLFPTGYHYYEHPEIYIPIIGAIVAAIGTTIFLYNFSKGRKVI